MKRTIGLYSKYIFGCALALGLLVSVGGARAGTVYTFTGGSDGGNPPSGLISGGKGVLPAGLLFYGTTVVGGTGLGTVFEVRSTGIESVLHSFSGGSEGAYPEAGLIADATGNLYGTTAAGGSNDLGVVFRLAPDGTETVLHSFAGGSDGASPRASLIIDGAGNLYGTTSEGGGDNLGVVFELTPGGTETVLHTFVGSDGASPLANVIMDASGNLYGTTFDGGAHGGGVVFRLAPDGTETVLHSFAGGKDGAEPQAGLILDKSQNLYGTTYGGGAYSGGVVFKLAHTGKETILHSFGGGTDGANPVSSLIRKAGYLYGTTFDGGANGDGTVFRTPIRSGSDTVLYSFTGGSDGGFPVGGVLDQGGNLFGTTFVGGNAGCTAGNGCGVVFEITP